MTRFLKVILNILRQDRVLLLIKTKGTSWIDSKKETISLLSRWLPLISLKAFQVPESHRFKFIVKSFLSFISAFHPFTWRVLEAIWNQMTHECMHLESPYVVSQVLRFKVSSWIPFQKCYTSSVRVLTSKHFHCQRIFLLIRLQDLSIFIYWFRLIPLIFPRINLKSHSYFM